VSLPDLGTWSLSPGPCRAPGAPVGAVRAAL